MTSEREAIDFLVDSISSQAMAEGVPISERERRLLTQCPVSTDDAEEPEDGFSERMAGLLRRAYKSQATSDSRRFFRAACSAVVDRDSNLSAVVRATGLNSLVLAWLLPFRQTGLFVLLAAPAFGALLTAVGLMWGAARWRDIQPDIRSTMAAVALALGAFGAHLVGVWRKDRRS